MRGTVLACLLTTLLAGCNTRQRVAGGGAGLAVIGLSLTYSNEVRSAEEGEGTEGRIGIACLLTGLVVLFVAAALDESAVEHQTTEIRAASKAPAPAPTVEQRAVAVQKKRDAAWALTKQAQDAARDGDCEKVTALSAQVGAMDAEFYADVFLDDLAIQRCFVPGEASPPAAPVPPPVVPVTP